jgi:hypothetical protein
MIDKTPEFGRMGKTDPPRFVDMFSPVRRCSSGVEQLHGGPHEPCPLIPRGFSESRITVNSPTGQDRGVLTDARTTDKGISRR